MTTLPVAPVPKRRGRADWRKACSMLFPLPPSLAARRPWRAKEKTRQERACGLSSEHRLPASALSGTGALESDETVAAASDLGQGKSCLTRGMVLGIIGRL